MKITEDDFAKMQQLQTLANIRSNDGQQFISVYLNLGWGQAGYVAFGFKYKTEMGEQHFRSLDAAIELVTQLRKRAEL